MTFDGAAARRVAWAVIVLAVLPLPLIAIARAQEFYVVDDAFMFVRYADHWLRSGVFSWNPGGPPVFGVTSVGYLALVTAVRSVMPGAPAAVLYVSSAIAAACGVVAAVALIREATGPWRDRRPLIVAVALLALWPRVDLIATYVPLAMDTTLAMFAVTLFLTLALRLESQPTRTRFLLAVVSGSLLPLVRPDLALFGCGMPALLAATSPDAGGRRRARIWLGVSLASLVVLGFVARHVFGAMLPLPFWAKTSGIYGVAFERVYATARFREPLTFLVTQGPLATALIVACAGPRRCWSEATPALRAAWLVAAAFFGFYAFCVTPIENDINRFYAPILPVVLLVGCRAAAPAIDAVWSWGRGSHITARRLRTGVAVVMTVLSVVVVWSALSIVHARQRGDWARFDLAGEPDASPCWMQPLGLPVGASVATTEVGRLASQSERVVFDLAGLNSPDYLRAPLDPVLLRRDRPDAVLSVHPDYREQIERLRTDPDLQREYEEVRRPDASGVNFVRRDSPYRAMLLSEGGCR